MEFGKLNAVWFGERHSREKPGINLHWERLFSHAMKSGRQETDFRLTNTHTQVHAGTEIHNRGIFVYIQDITVTTTKNRTVLEHPDQEIFTPVMQLCRGKRAAETSADILHCCIQSLEPHEPEKVCQKAHSRMSYLYSLCQSFSMVIVMQICFCSEWYLYAYITHVFFRHSRIYVTCHNHHSGNWCNQVIHVSVCFRSFCN